MTNNAPEQQADLAVTVKPLEWFKTGNPAGEIKAENYLGIFTVYENSLDCWTLDDGEAVSSHDTQEDAKSAAITECLRRVNETLDLIPDDATAALQAEKDTVWNEAIEAAMSICTEWEESKEREFDRNGEYTASLCFRDIRKLKREVK